MQISWEETFTSLVCNSNKKLDISIDEEDLFIYVYIFPAVCEP